MRRYLLFGALAVVAIAAGFSRRTRQADPRVPKHVGALVLSVDRDGPALRLRWDPSSIRKASYGELEISDGSHQSKLPLNQALLASGSFSYIPITQDVAFRLEIPGEPSISGFAKPSADPPPPVPEPAPAVAADPAPPKPRRTVLARNTAPNTKRIDTKPSPMGPPEPEPAHAESRVSLPEAPLSSPAQLEPPPPIRSAPPSRSGISMEAEPAPPSTIGRVVGTVGRLPLLRRLRKSETRVPPTPTFQVTPVISTADRRTLTGPLVVDVRVTVDETGKVESAEPVGDAARNTKFATAAAAAARRWKFTPARVGDAAVPAKLILHFRFQPADQ